MGLKLIPYEVKCHADSAISALQSDTSSYNNTWQKIEEFTKEEVLCGTAWMTMRRHMRIHQIITGTLIRANSSMIRDYETLKNTVGSEILDEDSLRLRIEILERINSSLERTIIHLEHLKAAAIASGAGTAGIQAAINACREKIAANNRIIAECNRKIELLYRIEAATAQLFIDGKRLYTEAGRLMKMVKEAVELNPQMPSVITSPEIVLFKKTADFDKKLCRFAEDFFNKFSENIKELSTEVENKIESTAADFGRSAIDDLEKMKSGLEDFVDGITGGNYCEGIREILSKYSAAELVLNYRAIEVRILAKLLSNISRNFANELKKLAETAIDAEPGWMTAVRMNIFSGPFIAYSLYKCGKEGNFSNFTDYVVKYEKSFSKGMFKSCVDFVDDILQLPNMAFELGEFGVDGIKKIIEYVRTTDLKDMPEDLQKKLDELLKNSEKAIEGFKKKIEEMDDEDWFEAIGYITGFIASCYLGGELLKAGKAGKVAEVEEAVDAGKIAEIGEVAEAGEVGEVAEAAEAGKISEIGKAEEALDITKLIEKSSCSKEELIEHLRVSYGDDVAELYKTKGIWPEGKQIPKGPEALKADGTFNWDKAPKGGYTLDKDGNAIKDIYKPEIHEIIDRYGDGTGRYVSPVIDGKSFEYGQRSLPYIEDINNYHKYEIIGDFDNIEYYVNKCEDLKVKKEILKTVEYYYGGDFERLKSYKGIAAAVENWGEGGAIQYEFPLNMDLLEKIGLIRKLN